MAKKRFFKRRASRSFSRKARRSAVSSSINPLYVIAGGAVYGATRSKIAEFAQPVTSMLPLGGYADEALFGLAGWFMAKKGNKLVKNLGYSILAVESASIGNQIAGGFMTKTDTNSTSNYYV